MSLWTKGGIRWWKLLRRFVDRVQKDQMFGHCAELSYHFLFSVFPLLLFLTTLLGYLAQANPDLRVNLFSYLGRLSPSQDIIQLLTNTLAEITQVRGTAKLSIGLLVAIWASSNGVLAIGSALNTACGLEETRPWWKRRLVAVVLTLTFAILLVSALAILILSGFVGEALAQRVGLGRFFAVAWRLFQWPLVVLFLLLSVEMLYNFAPDLGQGDKHRGWGTPGAFTAVGLGIGASLGYRIYLVYFHSYSRTYGSLGAVILLLLWLYITAFAILMGGEVNSELARVREEEKERGKAKAPAPKAKPRSPRRTR
jgi:membrane protein